MGVQVGHSDSCIGVFPGSCPASFLKGFSCIQFSLQGLNGVQACMQELSAFFSVVVKPSVCAGGWQWCPVFMWYSLQQVSGMGVCCLSRGTP